MALNTEGSEGDKAKPLERTKREPANIFKRDSKGTNPATIHFS
jgi:hypothetical protein